MTTDTTITLSTEVAQETLIALRDRYHQLLQEIADGHPVVSVIARRQANRTLEAGVTIATALGEQFH